MCVRAHVNRFTISVVSLYRVTRLPFVLFSIFVKFSLSRWTSTRAPDLLLLGNKLENKLSALFSSLLHSPGWGKPKNNRHKQFQLVKRYPTMYTDSVVFFGIAHISLTPFLKKKKCTNIPGHCKHHIPPPPPKKRKEKRYYQLNEVIF